MVDVQIPAAFKPLFQPKRYKIYYGGRGGAKSHNFARALLILGAQAPLRILCARELQTSIADSVHKLLSDIIQEHGLEAFYKVQKATISGVNGTEFLFKGLKHNATEIKSTEGIDICWVEEAEKVSDNSWELLIPTIRKEGSEIWVSFNTKLSSDPTYQRFVAKADKDMLVRKVTYEDNPFLPNTLMLEAERLKRSDPVAYSHVWGGEFDKRFDGSVYAQLLEKAREEGRITGVPCRPGVPVVVAWDLGKKNATSLWFAQKVGLQPRIIDFYEANNQGLDHYAQIVRSKPYEYGMHYIPHDGAHERIGMPDSISQQLKEMKINNRVLKISSRKAGIELARNLIQQAYFDETKCAEGIHALSHYQFEWDDQKQRFKDEPLKDWSSDAADAFRYLAHALEDYEPEIQSSEDLYSPSIRTTSGSI